VFCPDKDQEMFGTGSTCFCSVCCGSALHCAVCFHLMKSHVQSHMVQIKAADTETNTSFFMLVHLKHEGD